MRRAGDEPPADGADGKDWLVLVDGNGVRKLAFQQVERLEGTTWPRHDVPMQMHLDLTVTSRDELERHRVRAESLGAELPFGHPFCIFVA